MTHNNSQKNRSSPNQNAPLKQYYIEDMIYRLKQCHQQFIQLFTYVQKSLILMEEFKLALESIQIF